MHLCVRKSLLQAFASTFFGSAWLCTKRSAWFSTAYAAQLAYKLALHWLINKAALNFLSVFVPKCSGVCDEQSTDPWQCPSVGLLASCAHLYQNTRVLKVSFHPPEPAGIAEVGKNQNAVLGISEEDRLRSSVTEGRQWD